MEFKHKIYICLFPLGLCPSCDSMALCTGKGRGQMAERLGSRAINRKVVGSIPGRAK